jgi:hypothetical protein
MCRVKPHDEIKGSLSNAKGRMHYTHRNIERTAKRIKVQEKVAVRLFFKQIETASLARFAEVLAYHPMSH